MIGGLSYQVAHPPFVIAGHRPVQRGPGTTENGEDRTETGPEHAKGPAVASR